MSDWPEDPDLSGWDSLRGPGGKMRDRLLRALFAAGVEVSHIGRVADVLIRELPELQPCPFRHLSHNRCDCLRTADD